MAEVFSLLYFDVIIDLLFVLHVEANLNSQRHNNAFNNNSVISKETHFTVQSLTTHEYYIYTDEQFLYLSTKSITQ